VRAVVVGSGPNGLAAAIALARAGLDVEVFEAEPTLGGGARSLELTLPGFVHDLCSAVHPLGRASPFFRTLDLDVEWIDPPAPLAHPLDDGTAVVLERGVEETAAGLGGDGERYRRFLGPYVRAWGELEPVVAGPYPPGPRALARPLRALGPAGLARGARAALGPARAVAESAFEGDRARALFAGCAGHSLLPLERRPSAGFGLVLAVLGHAVGWPVARGGSQRLTDALVALLRGIGGRVHADASVGRLPDADAVLCDVSPPELLRLGCGRFSPRYERALGRYRFGPAAFKLDWALDGPIPWQGEGCRRAATVHLGGTLEEIAGSERDVWQGRVSPRPFVILAQQSLFDDTRAPVGKHTAWAYCHVPNGWTGDATAAIEAQVERFAPGFRDLILARSALGPRELEGRNRNHVGGDINGGAMDLRQLVFRPAARPVPYRTPLRGVYLCSSSTPPGGGVHGMCGLSAALVALRDLGVTPSPRRP
jgi:phytoene dehydrogenase-like protein